ncbi:MAG: hypothetical protein AAF725_07000 [Acidobacteriota bacterium]
MSCVDPSRALGAFVALALALYLTPLEARAALINDVPASAATYLGGAGEDEAGGVAFALDGSLLVAATLPGHDPAGAPVTELLGGGDGALLRLASDGRQVLEIVRVGDGILDLEVTSGGRVALAAAGVGVVLLEPDLSLAWFESLPSVVRVAVGGEGSGLRVAGLDSAGQARVLGAAGNLVGQRAFGDSEVADIAVAPDGQRVVVTGFNQRSPTLQVPFLRAFDPTLAVQAWRAYDWTADQVLDEQQSSSSDSRGVRVAFGQDGLLYFAGQSSGALSTFRFDPLIVDRRLPDDELISFDEYNTPFQTGGVLITVMGRFDPATGDVLKIQRLLARLSSNSGNSVRPASIAADAEGRIFQGGASAASLEDRTVQRLEGQLAGPYQGFEAFVLVLDPDFSARRVWTVFTAPGGSQNSVARGVAVRDQRFAWAVSVDNGTAQMLTTNAVQPARDAGLSAYFGVSPGLPLFADDFESGGTAGWSSATP